MAKTVYMTWPPHRVKSASTRFKRGGHDEFATLTRTLNGALIASFDQSFVDGPLGAHLWRDSDDAKVRDKGWEVFAALMHELFPMEFRGPAELTEDSIGWLRFVEAKGGVVTSSASAAEG